VLPERDEDAANLYFLSLLIGALVTIVLAVLFQVWGGALLALLNMEALTPYVWVLGPTLLATVIYVPLTAWNTRRREFGRIAVGSIVNATTISAMRIGAGLAGSATVGALVISNVLSTLFAATYQGWATVRSSGRWMISVARWNSMMAMLRRYSDQPRYNMGAALLNTVSWQLPVFMLAALFSPAVAGQYALGQRVIRVPMSLVGNSISQVFYSRAATARREGTLASLSMAIFSRLVTFGLAPTLFLAVESTTVFALVFGAEWTPAGEYVQVLAFWSFVWFISSPLAQLQIVLEKQRHFLYWNIINFITRFLSLWIGARLGSVNQAFVLFSASGIVLYGYLALYLLEQAGVPCSRTLGEVARQVVPYLPALVLSILLNYLEIAPWVQVTMAAFCFAITFLYTIRNEPTLTRYLSSLRRTA
jgi:O-antigen/teichoic acid export membrane protein